MAKQLSQVNKLVSIDGKVVVEIGTGWTGIGAIFFGLMGARTIYTYDHIAHWRFAVAQRMLEQIRKELHEIASITLVPLAVLSDRLCRIESSKNFDELFRRTGIIYKAPGDAGKTQLPDHSVDLIYSYVVLECVPVEGICQIIAESKRILRPGAIAYHAINTGDYHTSNRNCVNFLRYPQWFWHIIRENNIAFHNRLREKQFIDLFQFYGADVRVVSRVTSAVDLEALRTMKIDKRFSSMTQEELAVTFTNLVVSFPALESSI
ncbi:MAG: methyltransferase domain-containing protein [Planctomycetota bacterium]|nr:methyltransferase domain-containing protein [Planctomycetota bacterium]